jgi:hypothetical protein
MPARLNLNLNPDLSHLAETATAILRLITPVLHHSITPLLHYSITQLLFLSCPA